jgi:uncharacterized membrane protein YphA (DoxX/SURF4 family)
MWRSRTIPWLGLAVRLVAAGIWLVAGVAKLADLGGFRTQVGAYDLLPSGLVEPFAYALPFVEVGIGIYLVLGLLVREAAGLATFLTAIFIAAQAQAWARGLTLDCGCFGSLSHEQVGPLTILRDVGLGLPSLLMLLWPARWLSLDARLLRRPDSFTERFRRRAAPRPAASPAPAALVRRGRA